MCFCARLFDVRDSLRKGDDFCSLDKKKPDCSGFSHLFCESEIYLALCASLARQLAIHTLTSA